MSNDHEHIRQQEPMRVLFLCTHNSSRSQMAEGLLQTRGVHPLAIQVMREIGIDISETAGHRAKSLDEFVGQPPMDLVVTVCDDAAEECPYFPGARQQEHWGFPDPSAVTGNEEERLAAFRSVRDAIARRIEAFVAQSEQASTAER